jgi:hypothetical protein
MDFTSLRESLIHLETLIDTKINSKTLGKHNHPPMTGINSNCVYCKLYGNVFENGSRKNTNEDIKDIMFSVRG